MDLYFNLKLLKSPTSPFVIVAGGADADGNGVIDQASEVSAFKRGTGDAWTHTQTVSAQTKGMLFAVVFTVGSGVPWSLEISDSAGARRFFAASTTLGPNETVSYFLS